MPEEYFRLGYDQIPLLGPANHRSPVLAMWREGSRRLLSKDWIMPT